MAAFGGQQSLVQTLLDPRLAQIRAAHLNRADRLDPAVCPVAGQRLPEIALADVKRQRLFFFAEHQAQIAVAADRA